MGISAMVTTQYGEDRDVYIRLNSVEASNHGAPAQALFRGFLSAQAFADGARYAWEKQVEFNPDVSQPLWPQAYDALCQQEGFPGQEV